MSSYCDPDSQVCPHSCCNALSKCPAVQGDCFYYYDKRESDPLKPKNGELSGGIVAAILVGSILLVILAIVGYCCWKRSSLPDKTYPTESSNNLNTTTTQPSAHAGPLKRRLE